MKHAGMKEKQSALSEKADFVLVGITEIAQYSQ